MLAHHCPSIQQERGIFRYLLTHIKAENRYRPCQTYKRLDSVNVHQRHLANGGERELDVIGFHKCESIAGESVPANTQKPFEETYLSNGYGNI